jgi:hypothetical protein
VVYWRFFAYLHISVVCDFVIRTVTNRSKRSAAIYESIPSLDAERRDTFVKPRTSDHACPGMGSGKWHAA